MIWLLISIDYISNGTSNPFSPVFTYTSLFKPIKELSNENDENILKSLKNLIYTENKNLSRTTFQIQDQTERSASSTESVMNLSRDIQNLSKSVREALYYPAELTYIAPKQVNDIKSDIRSMKGMLLSRRNFPTASYNTAPVVAAMSMSNSNSSSSTMKTKD